MNRLAASLRRSRAARRGAVGGAVAVVMAFILISHGCSTPIANRNPTGDRFPVVLGQSLEETPTELPSAFAGSPAVLLVGYKQNAQFDIDRWAMGLIQAGLDAELIELPTIPGLLPTFASGWIDDGMRSGIPEEDWGAVVTLYGKAARPVAELTGTTRGQLARVIVLDPDGVVVWFDDKGYSATKAMAVVEVVSRLRR